MDTISIKRSITVRAVVTPSWKEEAERELSNGISAIDQQLGELEKEGQQIVDGIRRQSSNPLDPRVQEQVAQVQNQVASKRSEFEEQKRNLLLQQSQVRELEMEQIVEQGQIDSFCDLKVGDNLVSKMGVSILVRDGVVERQLTKIEIWSNCNLSNEEFLILRRNPHENSRFKLTHVEHDLCIA